MRIKYKKEIKSGDIVILNNHVAYTAICKTGALDWKGREIEIMLVRSANNFDLNGWMNLDQYDEIIAKGKYENFSEWNISQIWRGKDKSSLMRTFFTDSPNEEGYIKIFDIKEISTVSSKEEIKIKFQYKWRFVDKNNVPKKTKANRRITFCTVLIPESNKIWEGKAVCSSEDQFIKKLGRTIALKNTTKDMPKEFRKRVWDIYNEKFGGVV